MSEILPNGAFADGDLQSRTFREVQGLLDDTLHPARGFLRAARALAREAPCGRPPGQWTGAELSERLHAIGVVLDEASVRVEAAIRIYDCKLDAQAGD